MDNSTPGMPEKLVQYLDGELRGEEKISLEQQLATDQLLQEELDSLQSTREAIKLYGLQQKVAGLHGKMMEERQPSLKRNKSTRKIIRYSIAIAASLLILIGGYMAYNFYTLSADKVVASRYQPYELITVRDDHPVETIAEKAYREKNYKEVIRIHDAGEDLTTKAKFLCGAAAMELKDNTKAITGFKETLEANQRNGQTILNDEAEYYLSLAYISNRNYPEALNLLTKIRDDANHTYHKEVTATLIRQVKMLKRR